MNTSTVADLRSQNPSSAPAPTVRELWQQLGSSPAGLSPEEAQRRLAQHGYNELVEETASSLLKFLSYLWGPIPWMIEIAAILSAIVRHWADFWIILTLLAANAVVGFWEEKSRGWSAPREKACILARLLNSSSRPTPSAISRRRS